MHGNTKIKFEVSVSVRISCWDSCWNCRPTLVRKEKAVMWKYVNRKGPDLNKRLGVCYPTIRTAWHAWIQASATALMRSAPFSNFTQSRMRVSYRRFGTTYRSHLQGSRVPGLNCWTLEDETDRLCRNVGTKPRFSVAQNPKRAQISKQDNFEHVRQFLKYREAMSSLGGVLIPRGVNRKKCIVTVHFK